MQNENFESGLSDIQLASNIRRLLDINDSSPDGAVVFLTGPWGSGKTFFWKNSIRPALSTKNVGFVSLFGVQSVADLKEKLLGAILAGVGDANLIDKGWQWVSKLVPTAKSVIEGLSGINFKCDILELLSTRYIVCFDDLERLPADASMEEILGFINFLAEHKGYRCLVILNDAEFKSPHRPDFDKLREKLGLRTFALPFDLSQRFHSFLQTKSNQHGVTLSSEEVATLKDAVSATKTTNLRSVRFMLECFLQLRTELKREIPRAAISFLTAMVEHESSGHRENWDFYDFSSGDIYFREQMKQRDKDEEPDPTHDRRVQFHKSYFGPNANYRPYNCVFDVVKRGYLNIVSAQSELFPTEAKLTEAELLGNRIKDTHFFFAQDDELRELIKAIADTFSKATDFSPQTLFLLAKGYSVSHRLLELPDLTVLPSNFDKLLERALRTVEKPEQHARDLGHRSDLSKIFVDAIRTACIQEGTRRRNARIAEALASSGKLPQSDEDVFHYPDFLQQVFSNGYVKRVWAAPNFSLEDKQDFMENIISAMTVQASHSPGVKEELSRLHAYLTEEFRITKSKTGRVRLYRLLEKTGMTVPDEIPQVIKQNS